MADPAVGSEAPSSHVPVDMVKTSRLWLGPPASPAQGPAGAEQVALNVDDLIGKVAGYAKQGAGYGDHDVRGWDASSRSPPRRWPDTGVLGALEFMTIEGLRTGC